MTLENFFTLAELKDGLTDPARVKDLFAVIQEEKDSVGKNVGDSTRQWSTIASAIAATDNTDCLDIFVQLDGLQFIHRWLQDAQSFGTETGDSLVEDLLRALEKLPIDNHNLHSSGIWMTVKNLIGNNSSRVQDRARALFFDSWKQESDSDSDCLQDIEMATRVEDKGISPLNGDENNVEHPGDEMMPPICSDTDATMMDDAEQMGNISSYEKLVAPLEQRDEPLSADVTNAIESDLKEDIDAKGRDPCPNDGRTTNKNGECNTDNLQDSSGIEHNNLGDSVVVGEAREQANDGAENDSGGAEKCDVRPDVEPDHVVDPLEVARQVAIEVEREVMDCRERVCRSSKKIPDCKAGPQATPDTPNGEQKQTSDGPPNEVRTGPSLSAEAPSMGEDPLTKAENLGAEHGSCIQDFSSVTEAAQEPEVATERSLCNFDLNQEVYLEDVDQQLNLTSTSVSVISASRAATTGLPVAPPQFEGTLGWKGSAASSAFCTASPRLTHKSSKQREDCVDFDLNVADGSDDNRIIESLPQKQIVTTSRFLSGESSVEASPRKSERLHLDLNRVSDGSDGLRSPSPSSTSSSMQPAFRNIDLNDQPSFHNDYYNHQPVISIMGARVEVNRQNFVPQTLPLPHSKISIPVVDLNLSGPRGVLGLGSDASQYIGLVRGSAVYRPGGPIPYTGSSSAADLSASLSQMPYIMSMSGAPAGSNGVGARNNFDLNSGSMMEEVNTDNMGGLRQLFSEGRSVDEHLRGSKRKEADGGWEVYPVNFKHHQPPWI